jgi:hypothetical protein
VLPSIRILSKDDRVLAEFKDLAYFRRCVNRDPKGCEEQGFQVDFQTQDAKLLDNGGRVQVEFNGLEDCSGRVKLQDVVAIEQHHLSIDTGLAFSLNAAGSFVSHLEAALDANSRWLRWLSGDVDLRLTKIDVLQKPPPQGETPTSFLNTGGTTLDAVGRVLVSLVPRSSWLFLRIPQESERPWFEPVIGGGLRSVVSGDVDVRWRAFGGLRVQVLGYNAGEPAETFANTRGFVEAGYARDQFWRDTDVNRLYAEGQIEVPSFGTNWLRFLLRMKIDRGIAQPGPSEVRFSILTSLDPSKLGALIGLTPPQLTPPAQPPAAP